MDSSNRPSPRIFAGIFLVAAATLLYQITFTRIFSVAIWYHFAFLVVSLALFGFGASGVAVALAPRWFVEIDRLGWVPALFGVTGLAAYIGINLVPFSPFEILVAPIQILYFLVYVLLLTTPFFFAGATVVLLLRHYAARAGALYSFDLMGASVGTLLVFVALPAMSAPGAICLAVALAFASAACLSTTRRATFIAAGLGAVSLLVGLNSTVLPDVRLDSSKQLTLELAKPGAKHEFSVWNALARIDVVKLPDADPHLFIDAQAMTLISPPHKELEPRRLDLSTAALQLKHEPSIIIIGPGGGIDVQDAVSFGASQITAVEINSTIIDIVTDHYREFVGDVFSDPRVRLVRDEGRSFVDRSPEAVDIIQITLIDTWAASVSGAYSLTENYLYTVEAFESYYDHLTPDGFISITRWYFEVPRLVAVAVAALEARGVADPSAHIAVIQRRNRMLLLAKPTPFVHDEVEALKELAARSGWAIIYAPNVQIRRNFYTEFLNPNRRDLVAANIDFDLSAPTDESPFFFQMTPWSKISLKGLKESLGHNHLKPLALPVGQIVLLTALGIGLLLSVVLLLIPVMRGVVPKHNRYGWLAYFLALGVAFIIVEIVLMQRFTLFLGHPTYSVAIVLFAILLFSGLGSAWSDRRRGTTRQVIMPAVWLLPLALLLLAFAVPPLTRALIGLPHALRLAMAIACIAPVAFLMGMPFPVGIRSVAASDKGHIPWAWAANGCASVIGSVCAVLGAMAWSFSVMLIVAGVIYTGALFGLRRVSATLE